MGVNAVSRFLPTAAFGSMCLHVLSPLLLLLLLPPPPNQRRIRPHPFPPLSRFIRQRARRKVMWVEGRRGSAVCEAVCCGSAESTDSAPLDPDSTGATSHWVNINPCTARHGQIRCRLPSADTANNHTHARLWPESVPSIINLIKHFLWG